LKPKTYTLIAELIVCIQDYTEDNVETNGADYDEECEIKEEAKSGLRKVSRCYSLQELKKKHMPFSTCNSVLWKSLCRRLFC